MRNDSLKWMAVFAALVSIPPALLVGPGDGGRNAEAAGKPSATPAEDPPAPTITAVAPSVGLVDDAVIITLQGTNLGSATSVRFGPAGAGGRAGIDECDIIKQPPPSDKVLQCKLPAGLTIGEAQRFIVTAKKSSDASSATYTPLGPPFVVAASVNCGPECPSNGAEKTNAALGVQVHLQGGNFGLMGGAPPTVLYNYGEKPTAPKPEKPAAPKPEKPAAPKPEKPTAKKAERPTAKKTETDVKPPEPAAIQKQQSYPCQPVALIGPGELVCYLPAEVYKLKKVSSPDDFDVSFSRQKP